MENNKWIINKKFDFLWFIGPQIIPAIIIFLLSPQFLQNQKTEIFPLSWILIVLLIDVTHVYSSVYKTYFKESAWEIHGSKMKFLPLIVWMIGILIYSISSYLFWSCLAYFAVFHFIRQQYGFFRLYTKNQISKKWIHYFFNFTIYSTTVVPILIWHLKGPQNFYWMQKGDFKYFEIPILIPVIKIIYLITLILYFILEMKEKKKSGYINWGRILITFSTAFAWYSCILIINNDFTFSLVNVLGHGIPYFALIWITEKKSLNHESSNFSKFIFQKSNFIIFFAIIFCFAFIEEGIWDTLIWREHHEIFEWMYFSDTLDNNSYLSFIVPLLIMPQVVHYILDAYIWKRNEKLEITKKSLN
jgi:hypothetical protein